jgi:hypothetical protein
MHETEDDQRKRYRREHALWSLEGMMQWCLERGDEKQLEALTNLETVLNDLMVENARLRASYGQKSGPPLPHYPDER